MVSPCQLEPGAFAGKDGALTVLASVIVSAKLGMPFAARSTSARGLNNVDVLRNSVLSASVPSRRESPISE